MISFILNNNFNISSCAILCQGSGKWGRDASAAVLIGHLFNMRLIIKSTPRIVAEPHHKMKEFELIGEMTGKDERLRKVRSIFMEFVEKGAWCGHLSSQEVKKRSIVFHWSVGLSHQSVTWFFESSKMLVFNLGDG